MNSIDRSALPTISDYLESRRRVVKGRGRHRRADCPLADHGHRFGFSIDEDRGLWYCFACGIGDDLLNLHMRLTGLGFVDAARDLGAVRDAAGPVPHLRQRAIVPRDGDLVDQQRKRAQAADLWGQARVLVVGCPAHSYLEGRHCVIPPADGDLRWLPELRLFGFDGPAMVGRISDVIDPRQGLGLHLTWLRRAGDCWRRAERRYLGRKSGGVIRLWPDESVTLGLGVAEGVETALAAAHAFSPMWAAMDAGNLADLPVLDGSEALTVFADRDESGTGQRAAASCATRWLEAGREVRVILPDGVGHDIADEVAA